MRVAIIHYHLRTGGVTSVIRHTLAALADSDFRFVLLTGGPPEGDWPVPVRVIPGLGYSEAGTLPNPRDLARQLAAAAQEALGGPPDLWHAHNHSLGKNAALALALTRLAAQGGRLLLHIHDFPEDGRPANYRRMLDAIGDGDVRRLSRQLYPDAPQVHYAVLNGRDQGIFGAAGLALERLHLLPNPVWLPDAAAVPAAGSAEPLWLYPTRAIRRKNLGELLLLAAIAGPGERFAATRGPENPRQRPVYEGWRHLAAELGLPVGFEVGARYPGSFAELLASAHGLVTTSVSEGFGLAFLEPWSVGRPVVGRALPEITGEFGIAGVDLGGLYRRLDVPVHWIGSGRLESLAEQALQRVLGAYGREVAPEHRQRVLGAWVQDGRVDFGRLDEAAQEEVIRRVRGSPEAVAELAGSRLRLSEDWPRQVRHNRQAIAREYSLQRYGERVSGAYQALADAPCGHLEALDGDGVLDGFLAPERLFLLCS